MPDQKMGVVEHPRDNSGLSGFLLETSGTAFQFGKLFSPAGVGVLTVHILFCWDWCSWTS